MKSGYSKSRFKTEKQSQFESDIASAQSKFNREATPSEPSKVMLIIVVTRPLNCDIPCKCVVSLANRSSIGAVRMYNDFPPSSINPLPP